MDIREVYKLMDRFESSSMSKLELDMEGVKLSFEKGMGGSVAAAPVGAVAQTTVSVNTTEDTEPVKHDSKEEGFVIKAPLVGTFYRAASPEEEPFVTVGKQVKKGDVVGIIEAMKLMNEITAPVDGIVTAIEVENNAMVEYDEVLIRLKES